ncbi:MAG: cupredoxin domain-containing protein [Actinomycetota bacterium]|nr:cupredoxin domain-containing protein [Actinomycetota bacterium]MDZ4180727.1 cupredoxin domain-containing protein [Coriobacteriia bacterium]
MNNTETKTQTAQATGSPIVRYLLIGGLVVLAFFMSYRFAEARSGAPVAAPESFAQAGLDPAAPGAGGCCCSNSGSGEVIEGSAVLGDDSVQRIEVDASAGYAPNVIKLAAGVPAEITFGQGSGCMAQVMSQDLGFFEDLTSGPVIVKIEPLAPGTYEFSCGMAMVFGSIVVE